MDSPMQVTPRPSTDATQGGEVETRNTSRIVEVRPALDVLEHEEGLRIQFDVPGVPPEGADVRIAMPHLHVACSRPARDGVTIRYAASLTLPATIDPASLQAELRHGVLTLTMARSAAARPRRIPIGTADAAKGGA